MNSTSKSELKGRSYYYRCSSVIISLAQAQAPIAGRPVLESESGRIRGFKLRRTVAYEDAEKDEKKKSQRDKLL